MRIIDSILNKTGKLDSFENFANEYYNFHEKSWANYFEQAKTNLQALSPSTAGIQQKLLEDLINDFEKIIKATAQEIPSIILKFTTGEYENVLKDNEEFRKQIEKGFNYSAFRASAKASWFAEKFDIKACLYCNAQFALMVGKDRNKKKLLFQFDHFYNKSTYPFLSLTMGNLIPSCSTCNISKHKKEFSITTHIHPYYEDVNIKFDFYIDNDKALQYLLGNRDYKLLKPKANIIDSRFNEHNNIFSIESIYEKHTDIVEELILKSLYYNKSRRTELEKEFNDLKLSSSVIDRFVLGNYSLDSEVNKRPLAKLSKDIAKQLKII